LGLTTPCYNLGWGLTAGAHSVWPLQCPEWPDKLVSGCSLGCVAGLCLPRLSALLLSVWPVLIVR
jgi:hypothetical protein